MTTEFRVLTVKLDMPLEFDEREFLTCAANAIREVVREFGGSYSGVSLNHGVVSRAAHYAALAEDALGR